MEWGMSDELHAAAVAVLDTCRARGLTLVTAESCTGGLVSGALTDIAGSSDVVDRGYVTYSNEAKQQMLSVPAETIKKFGAVSRETAQAMALGALTHAKVDLAVAITGIAGPDGGTAEKPVGLVYVAAQRRGSEPTVRELRLGNIGRTEVRLVTLASALELIDQVAA
jgi:nicotinamide-nucleotide amidase